MDEIHKFNSKNQTKVRGEYQKKEDKMRVQN